jgi:hypothetical protein
MFHRAGVILPGQNFLLPGVGTVTYYTKELANWRADEANANNFSYKFTDADRSKGGKAPARKATFPLLVTALAATAGGELPKAGKGGSMSIIGAKGGNAPVKRATFAPLVASLAATAGGELPRAGKGGSMSIIGAAGGPAPVKKSKHKARQAAIDASGGSLSRAAFNALPFGDGRVNGTCRECNRACPCHSSLCLQGRGGRAPQEWLQCDACNKWRKGP